MDENNTKTLDLEVRQSEITNIRVFHLRRRPISINDILRSDDASACYLMWWSTTYWTSHSRASGPAAHESLSSNMTVSTSIHQLQLFINILKLQLAVIRAPQKLAPLRRISPSGRRAEAFPGRGGASRRTLIALWSRRTGGRQPDGCPAGHNIIRGHPLKRKTTALLCVIRMMSPDLFVSPLSRWETSTNHMLFIPLFQRL